jgi:hypothetical protein
MFAIFNKSYWHFLIMAHSLSVIYYDHKTTVSCLSLINGSYE